MPAGGMAAVLADPTTRELHIQTILDFADRLDADGIDLDYEQFAFADGAATWATTSPDWVTFVAELANRLHEQGRTLTVSIPPVYDVETTGDRGIWVYDHGAIAEHVDAIRIMAYDYSVPEAGPDRAVGVGSRRGRRHVEGRASGVPRQARVGCAVVWHELGGLDGRRVSGDGRGTHRE